MVNNNNIKQITSLFESLSPANPITSQPPAQNAKRAQKAAMIKRKARARKAVH